MLLTISCYGWMQVMQLEASLLHAEQLQSQESETVFQCRVEATTKVKQLRTTIQVSLFG